MMHQKIIPVDPVNPAPGTIARAGKIIQTNGVVIFPAQCLYGLAANALNKKTIKKVFNLKQRPLNNPVLVLIPDKKSLAGLVTQIPEQAVKLMDALWPGNLTLVFEASRVIPKLLSAGTGKIGIRIPGHPVARALVRHLNCPITGTSANLSGEKGCSRISQLTPSIINDADMVLDAGILKGGSGSSVVDVTKPDIKIVREGVVSKTRINEILAR